MSVPTSYQTSSAYIRDVLDFLKNNQFIYNYYNTHVIVNKVLSSFPSGWVDYFNNISHEELTGLASSEIKDNCPETLQTFMSLIARLKPLFTTENINTCDKTEQNIGLTEQKSHEIYSLAPIIDRVCHKYNIDFIIDVGSGLGYLPHLLNDRYNWKVLGVECKSEFVKQAYKLQEKNYPCCKGNVKFTNHFIDSNSNETLCTLYEEQFESIDTKSGCIIGLHACADLSLTILDLFTRMNDIKTLVIMPCCYHRIDVDRIVENKEYFKNFPASETLKEIFDEYEAETFLRRPFLRLACQQTLGRIVNMSEEQHIKQARCLLFRAILQDVVESANLKVRRLKRKSILKYIADPEMHFSAYLSNLTSTHELEDSDGHKITMENCFREKMYERWYEIRDSIRLFEALNVLQAAVQGLCENLVLLDRVEFLKEKGIFCKVAKVTDDVLSPRCFALIASKEAFV